MADSASSSSSTASSKCSSDTEIMVRAKVPKHGKVSERHKHKMRLRSSKRKHYHKKQQSKLHSSTDSEHRHKKTGRKRKPPQKRKRKPSHSPSSASEENSDVSLDTDSLSSDESSSEQECTSRKVPKHSKPSVKHKRKKAKLSVKSSRASARNRQLRAVFKNNFADLMLVVSDPEQLAAQLYAKSLISPATLEKIITLPTSRQQKNLHLLLDLDRTIRADPEKIFTFIDVIQNDSSLEDVGKRMSGEVTLKESAASPNHISSMEVVTRNVAKGSGSSKQEQYHSVEDVAYPDHVSVPHQLVPLFPSAVAKYKHYLKSVYEAKPTPVDDKLFIGPCAQYINLAIVKNEQFSHKEDDDFTRTTLHGGIDQILQKKEKVHIEDIFVTEGDCESLLKCILVEGPPGIGKSTFAWELCRKWDTLEVMQKYSLVLLIRLREKRVQNAKILPELFPYPGDLKLSQAVVDEISQGENVLLILDGLDEFPNDILNKYRCLIRQIINGLCLPEATIVVTSRPSSRMFWQMCKPQMSKHIEIIGFTEENRVKYARSAFNSQPDMLVHFLKYCFSNPIIKAMMYIPLNCAIVAQIYKECGGRSELIPKTMTQLYTALCHSLLRRYLVENSLVNSGYRMPQDLNNLPHNMCKHFRTLCTIAFDGIKHQKVIFYKHELPRHFKHMGFMNECRELYVARGVESSYNFLHLSLQEYLAAWHISQLPDTEQKHWFRDKDSRWLLHMSVVMRFMAGITGFRSAVWQDILQPETAELTVSKLMYTCLYETQNQMLCQQLLCFPVIRHKNVWPLEALTDSYTALIKKLHPWSLLTSSVDFYALGYCIAHSRGAWKIPVMSDGSAEAFEMFVGGLKDESNQCSPTGSVQSIDITDADLSVGVAWLKELPLLIISQLSELSLRECKLCNKSCELLAKAIPMMSNLNTLDVSDNHNIGPGGAVPLIKSLCSLKHLECLRIHNTGIGVPDAKALTMLISASKTLQKLHLCNPEQEFTGTPVMNEIFNALAVANVSELHLYGVTRSIVMWLSSLLPYNSTITSLKLEGDLQNDSLAYLSQTLHTNSHLISLTFDSFTLHMPHKPKFSKEEAVVLLNNALKHNTVLRNLRVCLTDFKLRNYVSDVYDLQYLANQLRKGPSGPQVKLKRAYSLPCLKHLPFPREELIASVRQLVQESKPKLCRCCSAPDLALTQSISSLHPSLTDTLGISQFYYKCTEEDILEFKWRYI